jgi:hypothetical protein
MDRVGVLLKHNLPLLYPLTIYMDWTGADTHNHLSLLHLPTKYMDMVGVDTHTSPLSAPSAHQIYGHGRGWYSHTPSSLL